MTTGAVLMAYGAPQGPEEIEAYYTDVRRGRPPSLEQLAELTTRYLAIGGVSPLVERTRAQVTAVSAALKQREPGSWRTYYGAKHAPPRIEDAVAAAAAEGAHGIVGVVLAPHYATASVGEYLERARASAESLRMPSAFVERYGAEPALVDLLHERVLAAIEATGLAAGSVLVCFTAHSLPLRALRPDDEYAEQIGETATLVAGRGGIPHFRTAWQSAGMTTDPWLGPDVLVAMESAVNEGFAGFVVCPCGFTSDHLEVLYDLDVVARRRAEELGISFGRTASLNDDVRFAALLAELIERATS